MLYVLWDQRGVVYYHMGRRVNAEQLIDLNRSLLEKWSEFRKRQHKVIFLHDDAPKWVRYTLEALSWEVLPHVT